MLRTLCLDFRFLIRPKKRKYLKASKEIIGRKVVKKLGLFLNYQQHDATAMIRSDPV